MVAQVEALNIPGGVIGVTGDGVGQYTRAFGSAAPGVPMSLNSEFRVVVLYNSETPCPAVGGPLELADETAVSLARTAYGASLARVGQGAMAEPCQQAEPVSSG